MVSAEDLPGDDREQQADPGEALVRELVVKTMGRNEQLLRRLAKE